MNTRPRLPIRLPLLLTAVCVALGAIIYGEIQRRPSASIADTAPTDYSVSAPTLPADRAFAMPPEEVFAAAVERPVFSPARRPARTPDSGMPALTSADFSLVGVVVSPGERVALVKPHSRDEIERLHEGDTLAGWSAVSIAPDRVVFRRGATEEEILLDYSVSAPALPFPEPDAEPATGQTLSDEQADQPAIAEPQPGDAFESEAPGTNETFYP